MHITLTNEPGNPPVTILHLDGRLDGTNYLSLVEAAQKAYAAGGRDLPRYQGNDAWFLPIPATFVVGSDGIITSRFVDPDYRRRMTVDDLLEALRNARNQAKSS